MSINYSEITKKLKGIDWRPIADKAWAILKEDLKKDDLSYIPEIEQLEYQDCLKELAEMTVLHMIANDDEKKVIECEIGFVKLSIDALEARNNLFAYRKTVEVIAAVLAATIAIAIAIA